MTKCNEKNINTLNCYTSNCIYLITCCRCGLQYVGETVKSLRDRFSGHRAGMKNAFADNVRYNVTYNIMQYNKVTLNKVIITL